MTKELNTTRTLYVLEFKINGKWQSSTTTATFNRLETVDHYNKIKNFASIKGLEYRIAEFERVK